MPINAAVFGPYSDRENPRVVLACGDTNVPRRGRALIWLPGVGKNAMIELMDHAAEPPGTGAGRRV